MAIASFDPLKYSMEASMHMGPHLGRYFTFDPISLPPQREMSTAVNHLVAEAASRTSRFHYCCSPLLDCLRDDGDGYQPVHPKEAAVLPLQAQAADEGKRSNGKIGTTAILLLLLLLVIQLLGRFGCSESAGWRGRCCYTHRRGCNNGNRNQEHDDGAGFDVSEKVGAAACHRNESTNLRHSDS